MKKTDEQLKKEHLEKLQKEKLKALKEGKIIKK